MRRNAEQIANAGWSIENRGNRFEQLPRDTVLTYEEFIGFDSSFQTVWGE